MLIAYHHPFLTMSQIYEELLPWKRCVNSISSQKVLFLDSLFLCWTALYAKKHIHVYKKALYLSNKYKKNSGSMLRNACSPTKHSYAWLSIKCDYWIDPRTDRQTDRRRTKWSLCFGGDTKKWFSFFICRTRFCLSLLFPKLWLRLFFSKLGQVKVKVTRSKSWVLKRKVITQGIHTSMCNTRVPSLLATK